MEVEENVPLLGSKQPPVLSAVLRKSSQGYRLIKKVGVEAKGLLGFQGNASDGDGKVVFTAQQFLNV